MLPARPIGPFRPRSPGIPGKPCGPKQRYQNKLFIRKQSLPSANRVKCYIPVIPIAPLPGHWQSRRGPQPLHSEP